MAKSSISNYQLRQGSFLLLGGLLYLILKTYIRDNTLLNCHGYDYMAGLFYYPTIEFVLVLFPIHVKLKMVLFLTLILVLTFFAALYWEYIAPLYRPHSVSDIRDIIAYMGGAFTTCILYYFNLLQSPYAQQHH